MKGDVYAKAVGQDPRIGMLMNMHIAEHMNPQHAGMFPGSSAGPAMRGGLGPVGSAPPPGDQAQSASFDGGLDNVQGPQENREQTMGGSGASQFNPSMGP